MMEIVLANVEDAKALSFLKKKIWETTYRDVYNDEDIDNYDYLKREEKFTKLINDSDQEVYVCKDKKEIIGYMVIGTPIHESIEGYDLCINDLGTIKEYQGKGIGRMFIDLAKSKNKKLFNSCNYYNKNAQMFYSRMGGKVVKTEIDENDKRRSQVYYVY